MTNHAKKVWIGVAPSTPFVTRRTLEKIGASVDNGVIEVAVPTPPGWKCRRKNCTFNVKHRHTTWQALK